TSAATTGGGGTPPSSPAPSSPSPSRRWTSTASRRRWCRATTPRCGCWSGWGSATRPASPSVCGIRRAARSTPTSSASSGPSSKAEAAGGSRLRLPDPQQAPQHDDLAEVVRVVVGGEERLAEEGVARRVVELGQEVGLRALDEADEFFHV